MRPRTSSAWACRLAAVAALSFHHGALVAQQATGNSYLQPSPPPVLTTKDTLCQRNTLPGSLIPDSLDMDYTCYNPQAIPEPDIDAGGSAFTYVPGAIGTVVGAVNGVCLSWFPDIPSTSFPLDPTNPTYQQPSTNPPDLSVQVGATTPVAPPVCNGKATFSAGVTISWPGGSLKLEGSYTTSTCISAYNIGTSWTSPASCTNYPATATCPIDLQPEGSTCAFCSNLCGSVCLNDLALCEDGSAPQCVGGTEPYCPTTPIIIDALGQGFHLTNMKGGVKFTFNGDSLQTSWTDPRYSNAWLVLDRNGNGIIDDASELFGEFTPQPPSPQPNGYKALAVFDDPRYGGNGNGRIDPGDAIYSHLLLWVDRNHDGISQPDELLTLPQAGVFAIGLDYKENERTDQFGNVFRYLSWILDRASREDPRCYDVLLMTAVPGSQPR
jgi:hypothetical protein